ncbi:regulatory protein, luxR family [Porphyromonadaceae bacterium KH3CP3RA]|nr:regulatory protein, luxR family [Porphyromonadaceae bacterium KH3CP3RA]
MKNKEFYITPTGGIMIHDDNGVHELTQKDRDFISKMIVRIGDFYPEALSALSKEYDCRRFNVPYYEYSIVSRFIRCNWGRYDSVIDVDQFGYFNFEEVECPLRGSGDCKLDGIVCRPKFNSKLSDRELEVMRNYYDNLTAEQVADRMCISIETVRTHKRNAFKRTGTRSLAEFFLYAKNNNLFND